MTRVVVTGASGFIGSRVLRPLAEAGHEVHAVARHPRSSAAGASWHAHDLLAGPEIVRELAPEVLLHLAWYTEHGKFWTAPENVLWVEASLALLRSFAESGGRRAVMAGTCAEYDWGAGDEVLRERDTPLHPTSLYGAAKHGLQVVAAAQAEECGFELAWGRVFLLYGPGEAPARLVPAVAQALLAGQPARTTGGSQVRDFLHVDDVAGAFAALVDSDVTGPVNVAAGEGVTVREVIELVAVAAGRPELVEWGALPSRVDEPAVLIADVGRLRDEVGFAPRISLREGIERTVAALRAG